MPLIDKPGTYVLTADDANWSESSKGTPFLAIYGVCEDGRHITSYTYFSDAAFERGVETMQAAFKVSGQMESWPEQIKGQQYRAVVEEDHYDGKTRMKVAWINSISAAVQPPKDAKGMFARMNALLRASGKAAPAKSVTQRPNVRNSAPVEDDDVPF